MTIGEKIYELRTKSGMTQEQLAEKMGVSRQAISKWESDVSVPELNKLKALANLFQVSLDEMTGEKSSQDNKKTETVKKNDKQKLSWILNGAQSVAIIILGVSIIIQAGTIGQIRNDIDYLRAENARLSSMVTMVPSEPEEVLFQEYDYELGEINRESKTIKLSFYCVPKQYSETTKITVANEAENGEIYNLELTGENGIYRGETELPICHINKTLLIHEDGGVKNTEVLYWLFDVMQEVYPTFRVEMPIESKRVNEIRVLFPELEGMDSENKRDVKSVTVQICEGTCDNEMPTVLWESELTDEEVKKLISGEEVAVPVDMEEKIPEYVHARVLFEHNLFEGEQTSIAAEVRNDYPGIAVMDLDYSGSTVYIER